MSKASDSVVVIGAGVGGLAAAAVLARAGLEVTVLEAQVVPGGCAGTFYHQGYRFDAGATLAGGFYPGGPMDRVARAAGIEAWPEARPAGEAMRVHLPGRAPIALTGSDSRWETRRQAFGAAAEPFWRWQERTAGALWELALRLPAWPPQSPADLAGLLASGAAWLAGCHLSPAQLAGMARDAFRPLAARLAGAPADLRLFLDAQLLISAQAESPAANALYAASALDLPRRGVVHLAGGMGAIAARLVQAVKDHGGQVLFRQEAARIRLQAGRPAGVETRRGDFFPAAQVIANLPPWNIAALLGTEIAGPAFSRLRRLPRQPVGWGAFVVYAGVEASAIPAGMALHQQVVAGRPLGEGNSVFISLSPEWDAGRAPAGRRALTLSTHTRLAPWGELRQADRAAYAARKAAYAEKILAAAEIALPGLRQAADLVLPGTPATFEDFTRRYQGWVGGFPQTSLLAAWGPRLGPDLWMVGDSIFPGQSTAAVALGGLRVAGGVLKAFGRKSPLPAWPGQAAEFIK